MSEYSQPNWKTEYLIDLQIVELTYVGENSIEDIKESSERIIKVAADVKTDRFLVESSKMITLSNVFDIIQLPNNFYQKWNLKFSSRIAVMEPESSSTKKLAEFYEMSCTNRGWNVKIFSNRENAITWLRK